MGEKADFGALARRIQARDLRATARAISSLENDHEFARGLAAALWRTTPKKPRLGITGSPGVGKSTLANILISRLREQGQRVGVVAVDPTSPFSGGAVLGDRVRMASAEGDPDVYIRSLGSRGSLGGVSNATAGIVRVLEAFGADTVVIETVGMGQTGFDIADISDTVALVLSPESGDGVQVMKAGVMEIADIYVVNKADRPGADALVAEMEMLLSTVNAEGKWKPPVLKMAAKQNEGADDLLKAFNEHLQFITTSGVQAERRRRQAANEIRFIAEGIFKAFMDGDPQREKLLALADRILKGDMDAYQAAERLLWGAASQVIHG